MAVQGKTGDRQKCTQDGFAEMSEKVGQSGYGESRWIVKKITSLTDQLVSN